MQLLRQLTSYVVAGLLLVQLLDAQQPGNDNAMQSQIVALPGKAHVVVHLSDASTMRGRIVSHNDQNFTLKPDNGGTAQTITYKQVAAVEQVHGKHSKVKWIVIGGVAGVVVAAAVIGVHAAHSPVINGF